MAEDVKAQIRRMLNEVGRLPVDADSLDGQADLYIAGMSSHASVDLMLELEENFEIEFPPDRLTRATFESIDAIAAAVLELRLPSA